MKRVFDPEGGWALKQAPREVIIAPSLTEFEKCLDNAPRNDGTFGDGVVQG